MTSARTNEDRTTRWYFVAVIILFAVISLPMATMGAVAVWNDDSGAASVRASNVDIELSEFKISGNLIAAPGEVTLTVTNKGTVAHDLIMSIVGLALFLGVAITSVRAARRRLSRETWYVVHLYAYFAVALSFAHQLAVGTDLSEDALARACPRESERTLRVER